MKMFEIYAKLDCPYCKKAINLLSLKGWHFIVIIVDKNPEFLQRIKETWNWPTTPIILSELDGTKSLIGGCSELEVLLSESNQ